MTTQASTTRSRRGRPFQTARRETYIEVRTHTHEKDAIIAQAKHAGLTTSEYVRRRALGQRVISRTDDNVINELRRLGGLQKRFMTDAPEYRHELNAILHEILEAIQRLDSGIPSGEGR
jgi:hypothetical protein